MGWDFWSGGDSKADNQAKKQAKIEAARQQEIEDGTNRIRAMFANQFTPEFYDQKRNEYLDFYRPQLEKQRGDSSKNLQFALARSGLLDRSSASGQKLSDLDEQYNNQVTLLKDRANQAVNARKTANQRAMEGTLLQLQSSADQTGAAADAAAQLETGSTGLGYEPLGQVFTDLTYGLATQADLERAGNSRYQTGIFSPGSPAASSGTNIK